MELSNRIQDTIRMKNFFVILLSIFSSGVLGETPAAPSELTVLGTRSWIKLQWKDNAINEAGYRIYWSSDKQRPADPCAVLSSNTTCYYIQDVKPQTDYHIWIEAYNGSGVSKILKGEATTSKTWKLDSAELAELTEVPSSASVPKGMQLYWHDEFNDSLLNRNKWTTNYFSSFNYMDPDSRNEMLEDRLPQPAYRLNGKTIDIFVSDSLPNRLFSKKGNQKISSIQTYDWRTGENLLDNSRGGYFEVKVKRNSTGNPKGLNTAFWFDSPGPDLRYYLEQGTKVDGVEGIRPKEQVFEIDVFENLNAQFVLHGHVDQQGKFKHNIATHIAQGYDHVNQWVTHGILWTPNSIKHYINGNLIKEYSDKQRIFSPIIL
ncbi:family 16 glycosylhydrolase [Pedobacter sp. HDW13]|uniref:fibronectin type III domain-containing protein n=1 Tax=Pedobacter sp. HDW13 TaxID=2714940 RepID=UPI0019811E54|nr:family 16 glycosylhydrolase [Pedobacter sp. HDW13]